jgi:signal transduction histidine kinase/DNA-binding response OmpR family regulator
MKSFQQNIALISSDSERLNNFQLYITSPKTKIYTFDFQNAFNNVLKSEIYDLIIFDLFPNGSYDIKRISLLRKDKLHQKTPFLYLLGKDQTTYKMEIYKDEYSSFIFDPIDKFELLNSVKYLEKVSSLEKRLYIYKDVLEGEKQLVNNLDKLLQINLFKQYRELSKAFEEIQFNFNHKMELTFAVEKVVYLYYLEKEHSLRLNVFDRENKRLMQRVMYDVSKSAIQKSINSNIPFVIEGKDLLDPFIQEIEETIGFEINSLLFAPLSLFHKTHGGFALINKIYRHNFSENDFSLAVLTIQKLKQNLELVQLKRYGYTELIDIFKEKQVATIPSKEIQLYKNVLESISFGLIVFNEKYEIKFLNKFAQDALGEKYNTSASLSNVFGEEAVEKIEKSVESNQLPALRQEVLIVRVGAQNLDLGYSIYPVVMDEKKHYALTFMEISQSKHIQSEIIRMDRMASLGVLASGIAHEIRNPLAGIKAMAQTLEEELEGDDTKIEYSQRIVRQVNRLDKLLKSFFSYAKPQRPNPIKCDIPDIVREVLPLFERRIKEKRIQIKEVYSPSLKKIFVDSHQIQQVFFNLIINAIHAMENGGILTIKARLPEETHPIIDRRQRIPKLFSDIYDEITISDTGVGMDSATLKNMYNPFYTTKATGTGLGLSIVYQIIREHGGQITVESEVGKGTIFQILLPVYIEKKHEL